MIRIIVENTKTGERQAYAVEQFTTMRTRMTPYPGEAFTTEVGTILAGSELGTLVCKYKEGTVLYRNEQLGIEAPMAALRCRREITR